MSVYQVVIKGRLEDAGDLRNIMHYTFPDYNPDATELQDFVDELDGNLKTRMQTYYHTDVDVNAYGLRRVDQANLPEADIVPTSGAWSGTGSNERLADQLTCMVTWKAPSAFPRTCRSYLFPMTEAANSTGGTVIAAVRTAAIALAADWLEIVVPGQANALKVAVKYSGTPRIVSSFNVVTSYSTPGKWRIQRRRLLGEGS